MPQNAVGIGDTAEMSAGIAGLLALTAPGLGPPRLAFRGLCGPGLGVVA